MSGVKGDPRVKELLVALVEYLELPGVPDVPPRLTKAVLELLDFES